jgi:endonuclease/exonuclease/phosphatase family metal-dependent hydrolase
MRSLLKVLAGLIVAVACLLICLLVWVFSGEYTPAPEEPVDILCEGEPQVIQAGVPFDILSWNLQFSAGRKHRFFYDGGQAVHVPQSDVDATVQAIADALQTENPQIVLLQEIDRASDRTGDQDQLPDYARAAKAHCTAAAPYHLSPYVPHPPNQPLGKVDMELGLFSRTPMTAATRLQLPMLDESRLRRAFNLKRAVLTAQVPVEGWEADLALAVTHLSAFSHGDGTMERQVRLLKAWMSSRPPDQPWVLAGDFNLLPPGDDPKRLGEDASLYAGSANPIGNVLPNHRIVTEDPLSPGARTYLPYGSTEPDRKIDYIFVGGPVKVLGSAVLRQYSDLSDHLPIKATLRIGPAEQEAIPSLSGGPTTFPSQTPVLQASPPSP